MPVGASPVQVLNESLYSFRYHFFRFLHFNDGRSGGRAYLFTPLFADWISEDDGRIRLPVFKRRGGRFSGDDGLTWPMIALGAVGVVSVASNVVPAQVSRFGRVFWELWMFSSTP